MTAMRIFIDGELTKEEEVYPASDWENIPDRVKENIFSKHGDISVDYDWWQFIYEDAENVGIKITSFDTDRGNSISGRLLFEPSKVKRLILENHGKSCDTYQTAKRFDLRRKDFSESEFERELLEDYLTMLRKEYEYLTSEKVVIETFKEIGFIFDKRGDIVS